MIHWAPFKKEDWYGLGGAEPFEDGSDPLYAELEIEIDGHPAFAVLDADGLYIEAIASAESPEGVSFPGPYAARAVAALQPAMDSIVLQAMPGAVSL